ELTTSILCGAGMARPHHADDSPGSCLSTTLASEHSDLLSVMGLLAPALCFGFAGSLCSYSAQPRLRRHYAKWADYRKTVIAHASCKGATPLQRHMQGAIVLFQTFHSPA